MHKHSNNMTSQAAMPLKKARYRIDEFIETIPNGQLMERKAMLAELLDISIPQLNRIIRGGSDPSGTQLRIIADFFEVPVDELYEAESLAAA